MIKKAISNENSPKNKITMSEPEQISGPIYCFTFAYILF